MILYYFIVKEKQINCDIFEVLWCAIRAKRALDMSRVTILESFGSSQTTLTISGVGDFKNEVIFAKISKDSQLDRLNSIAGQFNSIAGSTQWLVNSTEQLVSSPQQLVQLDSWLVQLNSWLVQLNGWLVQLNSWFSLTVGQLSSISC